MTTALPTIYPTGYAGTTADFRITKDDSSGAVRVVTGTVTVPATTATSTVIGLVPFNKGCKINVFASGLYTQDLDSSTNVAFDIGWTYYDSTLGTSDPNGFVALNTTPQSGGFIPFSGTSASSSGVQFTAATDGWLTVTNSAATTTSGAIQFAVSLAYDPSGVTNAGNS